MSNKNDSIDTLVTLAQEGDVEAFGKIYDIFLDDIYRFIFYKITHRELAEDLCEDTFVKVWQNIKKYRKTEYKFSSWLYKVAYNTMLDYLRKENVQMEEIVTEIHDESMDTGLLTQQYFEEKMIQEALSCLPENQREIIILKYINDLTNAEIAQIIHKSDSAVRTLLSRSLQKLKEVIIKLKSQKEGGGIN